MCGVFLQSRTLEVKTQRKQTTAFIRSIAIKGKKVAMEGSVYDLTCQSTTLDTFYSVDNFIVPAECQDLH